MKAVETYRWRVRWLGRWTVTKYHASEADVRIEHPEAEVLPGTLIVREVPETAAERAALVADISLSGAQYAPGQGPRR